MKQTLLVLALLATSISQAASSFSCLTENYNVSLQFNGRLGDPATVWMHHLPFETTQQGRIDREKMLDSCVALATAFVQPSAEQTEWEKACVNVDGQRAYVEVKKIGLQNHSGLVWFYPQGNPEALVAAGLVKVLNPDAITKECYTP